jgi:hypothetical protein
MLHGTARFDRTRGIFGNINDNSSGTQDVVSLSTDYVLGPGVAVGAAVDRLHWSNPGAVSGTGLNSYSGVALMTGVAFNF